MDEELGSSTTHSVLSDIIREYGLDQLGESGEKDDDKDDVFNLVALQQHQEEQRGPEPATLSSSPVQQSSSLMSELAAQVRRARVVITEQPAENKLRFRYACEGRSAGSLIGASSSSEHRTYPTIRLENYNASTAMCVVSLVEEQPPYKAHPHNLVGKDGLCQKGVCSVQLDPTDMSYSFQNLGIQCVRRKDAPASLATRQEIRVDPFKQGFEHAKTAGSIDLNVVRLCFQVFLRLSNRQMVPLPPVVSNVIKDRKAHSDLQIVEYSDDQSPVEGGKKLLLFCDKVPKDDIEVHFTQYTKSGQQIVAKGDFSAADVHHQFGICLRTPPYVNQGITQIAHCAMFLYRPKLKMKSDPVDFYYVPKMNSIEVKGSTARMGVQQQKRGRAQRAQSQHDEPSSGQLMVPPKVPTPHFGGQVSVVSTSASLTDPLSNPLPHLQQYLTTGNVVKGDELNYFHMSAGQEMQSKVEEAIMGHPQMTRELQSLIARDDLMYSHHDNGMPQQQQVAGNGFDTPNSSGCQQDEQVSNGLSSLNAFLQGAVGGAPGPELLPNLSISGELMPAVDDLSNNLETNLSIEQPTSNSNHCSLNRASAQAQSLHTPDVSSDTSGAAGDKRMGHNSRY